MMNMAYPKYRATHGDSRSLMMMPDFMSCNLKDFFHASTIDRPEYMRIPWKYIPDDMRKNTN